ncbi:Putative ubiquitin 3 binding protein But2 [Septoria linicola]|uniref:Ubiquitin 3 binding protein But2 n=1 Tax=Septoria linicola TaxID=215465 RepID=A0A9Q9AXN7_9PEZI|nr:Putative ubiquitin 3 binding protein But2 [Septoria linicola]
MTEFFLAASLVAGASAAALPRDSQCCFQLTAAGGASGSVGQLSDGQNRVGGNYAPATYCLNNGAITDSNNRGCILTPPTTQFQCDQGATPTSGFSIGSSGEVQYNGSTKFYACAATTDNSEYNIYTTPVKDQKNCVEITLSTGGKCSSGGASSAKQSQPATPPAYAQPSSQVKPSAPATAPVYSVPAEKPSTTLQKTTVKQSVPAYTPATSVDKTTKTIQTTIYNTPAPSKPAASATKPTSPSGSACQTELSGAYQTPHLIVPISKEQPDKAYGTQYNATISSDKSTIFNFDIPADYSGKSCSVVFLFPEQKDLETSAYTFSGSGEIVFSELSSAATEMTSANTCPSKKSDLGTVAAQPGNSYAISTASCEAGKTISIEASSKDGLSLEFFEDWNPSPIGVYVTSC